MNDELTSESQRVCRELQALRESATASEDVADTAAQWISSISPNQDYLPEDEMRREIEIFAQDEWLRRQPDVQRCGEDDTDPSSQEVYRAIRGLTGYVERTEVYREGGIRRTRTVRPLDEVIKRFPTSDGFADHLIERANMPARTETQWWWSDLDKDNLRALKELFEAVNQGKEPSAMLPRRMTVYVPRPLPESTTGLQLTLIDTRGLDGGVEARGDLQALLRDPRSLIVLCAYFKNAPGDSLRALLRSMDADAELRDAIPRILLLLLDQGDAEQVNGADDDREVGRELKIDECHRALEGGGITQLKIGQITAFDVLKDDRKELVDAIDRPLNRMIARVKEELEQRINNAREFLGRSEDELRPTLIKEVDDQIQQAMARHLPVDAPMQQSIPLDTPRW